MKKFLTIIILSPWLSFALPITTGGAAYNPVDQALIIVRDDHRIHQTQDVKDWKNWENLSAPTTTHWRSIAFNGKDTFIAVGASKNAVREYSENGQAYGSWNSFVMPGADGATTYNKIFYYDDNSGNTPAGHFLALTYNPSNLFISSDAQGKNWRKLQISSAQNIIDVAQSTVKKINYLVALDEHGQTIWLSQNNGSSWVATQLPDQCMIADDSRIVGSSLGFYFNCDDSTDQNRLNIAFFNPSNKSVTRVFDSRHYGDAYTELTVTGMVYLPEISDITETDSLWLTFKTINSQQQIFARFNLVNNSQPQLTDPFVKDFGKDLPNSIIPMQNLGIIAIVSTYRITVFPIEPEHLTQPGHEYPLPK